MVKENLITSLDDLKEFAVKLVAAFQQKQIVCLSGPMGTGKTQLVRYVCELMGVTEGLSSPSFSIHNCYRPATGGEIDHLDLYRIETEEDLESVGFWDLFSKDQALVFIEWADRIHIDFLPKDFSLIELEFDQLSNQQRKITYIKVR